MTMRQRHLDANPSWSRRASGRNSDTGARPVSHASSIASASRSRGSPPSRRCFAALGCFPAKRRPCTAPARTRPPGGSASSSSRRSAGRSTRREAGCPRGAGGAAGHRPTRSICRSCSTLTAAELGLGLPPLLDVRERVAPADDIPLGIAQPGAARLEPPIDVVGAPEPVLAFVGSAGLHGALPGRDGAREIVGWRASLVPQRLSSSSVRPK